MTDNKISDLSDAVTLINDGDRLAIGGHTFRRHPMALIYEIIRQQKSNLTLLGWNNSNDMDILIGANCVKSIETAYLGMNMFGLANNFRRFAQEGRIKVYEHSETTAIDMFRAGSMGLDFLPSKAPLGSDIMSHNPRIKEMSCPFTGEKYAAIQQAKPDVAIIHAHYADKHGNVGFDDRRIMEGEVDILTAKSATKVIASVEEIVDTEYVKNHPQRTLLPSPFITRVVKLPYGAHPTSCDCRYNYDVDHLDMYYSSTQNQKLFQNYLDKYIVRCDTHSDYLELIGGKKKLNQLQSGGNERK